MVRKRKKGKGKRGKKKFRMLKNRQKILASRKQVDNKKKLEWIKRIMKYRLHR